MIEGRTGLDSPTFQGRLRTQSRRSEYERRFVGHGRNGVISDIRPAAPAQLKPAVKPAPVQKVMDVRPAPIPRPLATPPTPSPVSRVMPITFATNATPKPTVKALFSDIRPPAPRMSQPASTVLHTRKSPSRVLKRQGVQAPLIAQSNKSTKQKMRKLLNARTLVTVAAVIVVLGGLGIGLQGLRVNKEVAAKTTELATVSQSAANNEPTTAQNPDIPAETNPPDVGKHTVAANLPRLITIDKIGVKARVVRIGVKTNNQLAAPANIFDAGWYNESSKPGEAGAMVMDGHVSGPTKPGVFKKLHTLAAGDQIKVDRGDGKSYTYKVVKKASYAADKVDMNAVLVPVTPGKPGLNLITCSGEIDSSGNHYKERTVVFAEQI